MDVAPLMPSKDFDRVRCTSPVPSGARVRLVADLLDIKRHAHGCAEAMLAVAMEIEGTQFRLAYTAHARLPYQETQPCE